MKNKLEEYVLTNRYEPKWIYDRRQMTESEYWEKRREREGGFYEWYKVGDASYTFLGVDKLPDFPNIE